MWMVGSAAWAVPDGPKLVEGEPLVAEHLRIELGTLTLDGGGVLTPIAVRGDDRPIGFVWTGTISAEVPLASEADRVALANRLVRYDHSPVDDAGALVRGEPLRTTADTVLILAPDPDLDRWLTGLPPSARRGATGGSLRRARGLLAGSVEEAAAWAELVRAHHAPAELAPTVVDLRGDRRLRLAIPKHGSARTDGWVTWSRDPTVGVACTDVVSVAADPQMGGGGGTLTRWDCPAPTPVVPELAEVTVRAERSGPDDVSLEVAARITVRAGDVPVHVVRASLGGLWALGSADDRRPSLGPVTTADGSPVPGVADDATWRFVLPTPLAPGEAVTLNLPVSVRVPLGNPRAAGHVGRGTAPLYPVPQVGDAPFAQASVSVEAPDDLGWVSSDPRPNAGYLAVAFGEWESRDEPSVDGLPAMEVDLFASERGSLEQFPGLLRMVVAYDQQTLPPLELTRLQLFQVADAPDGYLGEAPSGLVALQQARTAWASELSAGLPHLTELLVAHEVAHQWFGNRLLPARPEDRWVAESFAQLYAELFARAAYGPEAAARWRAYDRETCLDWGSYGIDVSVEFPTWGSLYRCGPTLLHALRARVGDQAFFTAVNQLATRGGRVDSAQVVAAFSAAAGVDVEPFVGWWLQVGLIPELRLTTTADGATLTGEVRSDLPFGRLEVPVRVDTPSGPVDLWVPVVDGIGRFTATGTTASLDPDHLLPLARGSGVRATPDRPSGR